MITEKQKQILEHSLGLDRRKASYRNHFVSAEGTDDWENLVALEKAGLMRRVIASFDFCGPSETARKNAEIRWPLETSRSHFHRHIMIDLPEEEQEAYMLKGI